MGKILLRCYAGTPQMMCFFCGLQTGCFEFSCGFSAHHHAADRFRWGDRRHRRRVRAGRPGTSALSRAPRAPAHPCRVRAPRRRASLYRILARSSVLYLLPPLLLLLLLRIAGPASPRTHAPQMCAGLRTRHGCARARGAACRARGASGMKCVRHGCGRARGAQRRRTGPVGANAAAVATIAPARTVRSIGGR